MNTFKSIDELLRVLEREKTLLKQMFQKRPSASLKYDYALELTDYKEERIKYLIDYGMIRDSGNFLEMEDVYLKFFEDVLQVNENINVSFVDDYLGRLNENIDYYLKEDNEQRKYNYHKEVRRCLKNIAMVTVRNVIDLKRNIDNTYKNEPNYRVKLSKLKNLDEKRKNIAMLINKSEDVIENRQPVFFRVAMDTQMRTAVSDVRLQLTDSYHNLIEIEKQIIHYLNLIAYQNRIFEKVRRLKYLRDQFLLEEKTDIRADSHSEESCMDGAAEQLPYQTVDRQSAYIGIGIGADKESRFKKKESDKGSEKCGRSYSSGIYGCRR